MCELLHLMETEHGIKTAKASHTTHGENDCMLATAALCFIIFLCCYHKLRHRHWNLLNLSTWTRAELNWASNEDFKESEKKYTLTPSFLREMEFRFTDCDRNAFYAVFFQVFGAEEINSLQFFYDGRRIKIFVFGWKITHNVSFERTFLWGCTVRNFYVTCKLWIWKN